jgi:hypothetical protein
LIFGQLSLVPKEPHPSACAELSPEEGERKKLPLEVLMSPLHLLPLIFKQFAF